MMKTLLSFLVLVLLAINDVTPSPGTEVVIEGAKGTKGYLASMGGAIRLVRDVSKPKQNGTLKTAEITVSFEQIRELNANLVQVVDNANRSHVLKSFSEQNFTCINDYNYTMPHSYNVTADCLFCWTNLKDFLAPASFRINACVIKQNGTIKQKDEVSTVTVGQLKFTVEVTKGWPWCNSNCSGGAGAFLDLDIAIKLPLAAGRGMKPFSSQELNRPKKFDLGSGALVEFSTVAYLDGVWNALSHDTPSLVQKDGLNVITLRFPQFNNNLVYDPTVETGDKAWPGSAGWRPAASAPLLVVAAIFGAYLTTSA